MPVLWLPVDELEALQAVLRSAEEVNWEAYERAKFYILQPQAEAASLSEEGPPEARATV